MPYCSECGTEVTHDARFCPECGSAIRGPAGGGRAPLQAPPAYPQAYQQPYPQAASAAWYLLPIFFGLIGGLIAYFCIKDRDPGKAKNCLIIGLILTVIGTLLTILAIAVYYATPVPSPPIWEYPYY
jgi:uncharacterized membrane protein YeaQ/YmgE (transglycosylase-associated protein family)